MRRWLLSLWRRWVPAPPSAISQLCVVAIDTERERLLAGEVTAEAFSTSAASPFFVPPPGQRLLVTLHNTNARRAMVAFFSARCTTPDGRMHTTGSGAISLEAGATRCADVELPPIVYEMRLAMAAEWEAS